MRKMILSLLIIVIINFSYAQEKSVFPVMTATGQGTAKKGTPEPQAKLLAKRAAQQIALRNLVAKIKGILPTSQQGKLTEEIQGIIAGYTYDIKPMDKNGIVTVQVVLSVDKLLQNYHALVKRMNILKKNVTDLSTEKKLLGQKLKVTEEKNSTISKKNNLLQKDNETLAKQKKELAIKNDFLKKDNETSAKQIKDLTSKNSILQKDNDSLAKQIKESLKNNKLLYKANKSLADEIKKLAEKNNILRKKNKDLAKVIRELTKKNSLLQKDHAVLSKLDKEVKNLKHLNKKSTEKNIQLKKDNENLTKQGKLTIKKILKNKKKIRVRNAALEKENLILSKKMEQLQKKLKYENNVLKLENIAQKRAIEKLKNKLSALESRYNEQNKALLEFQKENILKHNQKDQAKMKKLKKDNELLKITLKRIRAREQKQQSNIGKLIDLMEQMDREINNIIREEKYTRNKLLSNSKDLEKFKTKYNLANKQIKEMERQINYWKKMYTKTIEQMNNKNNFKFLENVLKDIYINQRFLLDRMKQIDRYFNYGN